jgi:hypothetical protein
VLAVSPQLEPVANHALAPVVTVLARSQDVDLVALADSTARIRVSLRNPLDDGSAPRRSLALASVFSGAGSTPVLENTQRPGLTAGPQKLPSASPAAVSPAPFDHPVQLHVQVLGASASALGELDSRLSEPAANGALNVATFRSGTDAGELVRGLEHRRELEVVSSWTLTAGVGRPISFRAGATPNLLRVQFSPQADSDGKISLRVKPEVTLQHGEGVETRKYASDLPDGASFLVKGLVQDQSDRGILDRLYPGHAWGSRELVIFVTTRGRKQLAASAFTPSNRGR